MKKIVMITVVAICITGTTLLAIRANLATPTVPTSKDDVTIKDEAPCADLHMLPLPEKFDVVFNHQDDNGDHNMVYQVTKISNSDSDYCCYESDDRDVLFRVSAHPVDKQLLATIFRFDSAGRVKLKVEYPINPERSMGGVRYCPETDTVVIVDPVGSAVE